MGKLNIAHHKSYHPYRRDNIEKVRRDEEEAQRREEQEEGRMMVADSEARLQLLRDRASTSKSKRKEEEAREQELLKKAANGGSLEAPPTVGHINFFEDLEQGSVAAAIQKTRVIEKGKTKADELEKGIPLAPSAKDLKPWYSAKEKEPEVDENKKAKDLSNKSMSDPLTSINKELASRYSDPNRSFEFSHRFKGRPSYSRSDARTSQTSNQQESTSTSESNSSSALDSRLQRESSERQRALELIKRKKRLLEGSETPSTVYEGRGGYKYGDQFNRREVNEAHAYRITRNDRRKDPRERPW